jgi:hypothetical protein
VLEPERESHSVSLPIIGWDRTANAAYRLTWSCRKPSSKRHHSAGPSSPIRCNSAVRSRTGDRTKHTFNLERLDGTPADPPSFKTTVLAWSPGDRTPISAGRTLQVVRPSHDDADELPVLVVEDLA